MQVNAREVHFVDKKAEMSTEQTAPAEYPPPMEMPELADEEELPF